MLLINLCNTFRCSGTKSLTSSRHTNTHKKNPHTHSIPLFLSESVCYLSLSYWRNIAVGHEAPAEKINVVRNKHDTTVEPCARLPQSTAFMFGYKSIYWKYTCHFSHWSCWSVLWQKSFFHLPLIIFSLPLSLLVSIHVFYCACMLLCGRQVVLCSERCWNWTTETWISAPCPVYLDCALYLSPLHFSQTPSRSQQGHFSHVHLQAQTCTCPQ